jgi:hypothetical protein
MLLRPLFEAVVTASWASRHQEETNFRYSLNRKYLLTVRAAAHHATGLYNDIGGPDPVSDDELREARRLIGRYGELPWTGVGFHAMAEEFVEQRGHDLTGVHCRA